MASDCVEAAPRARCPLRCDAGPFSRACSCISKKGTVLNLSQGRVLSCVVFLSRVPSKIRCVSCHRKLSCPFSPCPCPPCVMCALSGITAGRKLIKKPFLKISPNKVSCYGLGRVRYFSCVLVDRHLNQEKIRYYSERNTRSWLLFGPRQ